MKRKDKKEDVRFMSSVDEASSLFEAPDDRASKTETEASSSSSPIEDNEFETKAITCFRGFIFFLMVASTVTAGVVTWYLLNKAEEGDFQQEVSVIIVRSSSLAFSTV